MAPRLLIVGARSVRQGTGPFLAAALARSGANINAVVGTSDSSVESARQQLQLDHDIVCAGYTDLQQALDEQRPQAVVLCSPWQFHAEQLARVAAAGCHCLVEKPLAWPATADQVDALVAAFEQRELLLQMVAQWPCTLAAFAALHGSVSNPPAQFSMRLSPISIGPDMVTDSAPHFLSMLHALLGPGSCDEVTMILSGNEAEQQLKLHCHYSHSAGSAEASLLLATCEHKPRPAWYEIDGLRADRRVELPQYQQYFTAGQRQVALADPLQQVADNFLSRLDGQEQGTTGIPARTDGELLRAGHNNLLQLAAAWPFRQ